MTHQISYEEIARRIIAEYKLMPQQHGVFRTVTGADYHTAGRYIAAARQAQKLASASAEDVARLSAVINDLANMSDQEPHPQDLSGALAELKSVWNKIG